MKRRTAYLEKPGDAEGKKDAQNKDKNISPQKMMPCDSCVGKIRGCDKKHAEADRDETCCQKASGRLEKHKDFKQGVDKDGKEQQL